MARVVSLMLLILMADKLVTCWHRNDNDTFQMIQADFGDTKHIYPWTLFEESCLGYTFVLPALLQKLVGDFLLLFRREIWREILWDFSGPQNEGSKSSGDISEHFS